MNFHYIGEEKIISYDLINLVFQQVPPNADTKTGSIFVSAYAIVIKLKLNM